MLARLRVACAALPILDAMVEVNGRWKLLNFDE